MNKAYRGVFRLSNQQFSENQQNLSHRKAHDKKTNPNQPLSYHGRKTPLYALVKGSFTVEAALALPLFLYLILALLLLFQVMRLEMVLRDAAYDAARTLAATAYVTEQGDDQSALREIGIGSLASAITVQSQIKDETLLRTVIGGRAGIVSRVTDDSAQMITVQTTCLVKLPIPMLTGKYFRLDYYVRARKWTGYSSADDNDTGMVYVTETGNVYHKDRDCTYLNPSIHAASSAALPLKRNHSGGKYHACSLCGKTGSGVYYITDYGDTYHSTVNCSGLKRTIYCVTEDETSFHACSKCGGE